MTTDTINKMSAMDLAAKIRERVVSPTEVLEAILTHIEKTNPALNAFITISEDRARQEAAAAEILLAKNGALPPLLGVPYTVKDLVDTAGVRTTYASAIMEHNVPAKDAVVVERMKAAGAVLVGKVSTPEFGHKPMNESPLFGRTLNPWDLSRTSGGSSGGSAAALASGMAPLSIGTDAGGSIRIPAACCGVVGMKGTMGLVPHDSAPDGFGNFSKNIACIVATPKGTGIKIRLRPVTARISSITSLKLYTRGPPSSYVRPRFSVFSRTRAIASVISETKTGWNLHPP